MNQRRNRPSYCGRRRKGPPRQRGGDDDGTTRRRRTTMSSSSSSLILFASKMSLAGFVVLATMSFLGDGGGVTTGTEDLQPRLGGGSVLHVFADAKKHDDNSGNKKKKQDNEKFVPRAKIASDADLFEPSDEITVISSTHFPKPTRKISDNATVIIEPTIGKHRRDRDAVFAYAEGYKLSYYMMFVETLASTGFNGDVVMAVAEERIIKADVMDYLGSYAENCADEESSKPCVVVYQVPLDCDGDNGTNQRRISKQGDTDAFQMCRLPYVYGWKDGEGNVIKTAHDPREGRVVATIRYEWYWIWSLRYDPHVWIMLIDARDTYFQTDPFADLPREDRTDSPVSDGLLYLFGENAEATRIGKSTKNLKWIKNGYGQAALDALHDKPTICSGSTMGEQVAIETYLRAMVNEHDECQIRMTGSDQGFHNYLYYSRKLANADTIRRIVVWEQGRGIINNLSALRTRPLQEWGVHDPKTNHVFQWDGKTLSPVCHQFDRDHDLFNYIIRERHGKWTRQYHKQKTDRKQKQH